MKTTSDLMRENAIARQTAMLYKKQPQAHMTEKLLLPMAFVVFIVSVLAFVI